MEYSSQRELLEDKCARNYDKYYDAVHRDIFADVDLDRFAEEIENANDNYTTEILKQLHDKFVEIYDTDSVDGLVGFIQVPAIVESLQTGDYYPALVTLDELVVKLLENLNGVVIIGILDFIGKAVKVYIRKDISVNGIIELVVISSAFSFEQFSLRGIFHHIPPISMPLSKR